jgi:hypothetical protein
VSSGTSPTDTPSPSASPSAPELSATGTATATTVTVGGPLTGSLTGIPHQVCNFGPGLTAPGSLQGPAGHYTTTLTVAQDPNTRRWSVEVQASPNSTSLVQYLWVSTMSTGGTMTPAANGVTFHNLVVPSTGGTNGGPGQLTLDGGLTCVPLG